MKPWRRADNAMNNAERVRRYRARHRALGLCIRCPNPVEAPFANCAPCRAKCRKVETAHRRYGLPLPVARALGLDLNTARSV